MSLLSNAPAVNVYVHGEAALEGVAFKQSSGLHDIAEAGTMPDELNMINQ